MSDAQKYPWHRMPIALFVPNDVKSPSPWGWITVQELNQIMDGRRRRQEMQGE